MTPTPAHDIDSVSTEDLISELERRLAVPSTDKASPEDRWKAPSKAEVLASVLRLLEAPRLATNGGWPDQSRAKVDEIDEAFCLIRGAVMEPDPDGAHVLRFHFEVRNQGYFAAQPITIPHEILTTEDLKTAFYAMASLGKSIDRISDSVRASFGYTIEGVTQTERGKYQLAAREDKNADA